MITKKSVDSTQNRRALFINVLSGKITCKDPDIVLYLSAQNDDYKP